MGRETRAAREAAEQFETARFEARRASVEKLEQEVNLKKKERDVRQLIAELRGDVSLEIAAGTRADAQARFDVGARQRKASVLQTEISTDEAKLRIEKLERGLTLEGEFQAIFDDISRDTVLSGLGPEQFNEDAIARRAARALIIGGRSFEEVNAVLVSSGFTPLPVPNVPERIIVSPEQLSSIRSKGAN